jgi:hypothetical protein
MKHLLLTTIAAVLLVGCGPKVDIWRAAHQGNVEAIRENLRAGIDVDIRNEFDQTTPLHSASNYQVAHLLILEGADVDARDEGNWTPLIWAAFHGRDGVVRILIDSGVNAQTDNGWTALISAARGYESIVKMLLNNDADPNLQDHINGDGSTALHIAALAGNYKIVQYLLMKGSNINAKMNTGETPLDGALKVLEGPKVTEHVRNERKRTAELLRRNGAIASKKYLAEIETTGQQINAESRVGSLADIQNAIKQFNSSEGRYPKTLHELASKGYLPNPPRPRPGMRYIYNYKTGQVGERQ